MKFLLEPWNTIWANRGLIYRLTVRKIESKHRGSIAGVLWMLLDPILILGVYLFVFGYIFQGRFKEDDSESRIIYGITVFLGLAMFRFFSEVMSATTASVISNRNYVKKIVFPTEILPIIDILAALYSFAITMVLVLIGIAIASKITILSILWVPIIVFVFLIFLIGLGWFFSSITVYILDTNHIIQFLSISLLFGSAIFYPVELIPESFWIFLKFNPILHFVEISRKLIIWETALTSFSIIYTVSCSIIIFYIGFSIFRGLKKGFSDVL